MNSGWDVKRSTFLNHAKNILKSSNHGTSMFTINYSKIKKRNLIVGKLKTF